MSDSGVVSTNCCACRSVAGSPSALDEDAENGGPVPVSGCNVLAFGREVVDIGGWSEAGGGISDPASIRACPLFPGWFTCDTRAGVFDAEVGVEPSEFPLGIDGVIGGGTLGTAAGATGMRVAGGNASVCRGADLAGGGFGTTAPDVALSAPLAALFLARVSKRFAVATFRFSAASSADKTFFC